MAVFAENTPLLALNTFGIDAKAKYFTAVGSVDALQEVIQDPVFKQHQHLILGGGSNILFTRDFDGLVILSSIHGIHIKRENDQEVVVEAGAAENWHSFVMHCIERNWGGLENLSLIPGTCGAAPIQNIGAYGVELSQVVESVSGIDLSSGQERTLTASECQFNYRESVFKHTLKEKFFISSITLRLTKKNHRLATQYGAIQEVLRKQNITSPGIRDISDAVISIRRSKLPDPAEVGNAGSFFKNPTISRNELSALQQSYPGIPSYPSDNQTVKIPAAWMIEQCGWKGKRVGKIGVHPMQALVLVNYGGGKGEEIFNLSQQIRASVKQKFSVDLITEVNIV